MLRQQNHECNGIRRGGPNTTRNGHSVDEAVLEPNEPTHYYSPPNPTLCFQHAAKYPMWWRFMS